MEVVVVAELGAGGDAALAEETHAVGAVDVPLLHLAVRLARVVDEARQVAHAVAVDHQAAVQVQAVVVVVLTVVVFHASLELFLRDHLADVLHDELACTTAVSANFYEYKWHYKLTATMATQQ